MATRKAIQKYKLSEVAGFTEFLKSLPKVENSEHTLNTKEVIQKLKKEIIEVKKKGYTFEQIAKSLSGKGLPIATHTLKLYTSKTRSKTTTKADTLSLSSSPSQAKEKAMPFHQKTKTEVDTKKSKGSSFDVSEDTKGL